MIRKMSTGDLSNNIEKLKAELKSISYDFDGWSVEDGAPGGLLPILQFALLDFSRLVARFLSANGYKLYPKNDRRFVEGVFRVMRDEFSYRPSLTVDQFLKNGFAERKIIFITDLVKLCKRKHEGLKKKLSNITMSKSLSTNDLTGIIQDEVSEQSSSVSTTSNEADGLPKSEARNSKLNDENKSRLKVLLSPDSGNNNSSSNQQHHQPRMAFSAPNTPSSSTRQNLNKKKQQPSNPRPKDWPEANERLVSSNSPTRSLGENVSSSKRSIVKNNNDSFASTTSSSREPGSAAAAATTTNTNNKSKAKIKISL